MLSEETTFKLALGIEYDGSRYYGWQRQNEVRSVQEKLEKSAVESGESPGGGVLRRTHGCRCARYRASGAF